MQVCILSKQRDEIAMFMTVYMIQRRWVFHTAGGIVENHQTAEENRGKILLDNGDAMWYNDKAVAARRDSDSSAGRPRKRF